MFRTIWKRNDSNIVFEQRIVDSDYFMHINRYEPIIITANGLEVYYRQTTVSVYLWSDGVYVFKLETSDNFSIEQIKEIIENVRLYNEVNHK